MNSGSGEWVRLLVPDVPSAAEVRPYMDEMDARRWYTNFGPLAGRFEAGLAAKLGVTPDQVVAFSSCTLTLEAALSAILPRGGRVLVPALTFVATAAAVCRAGSKPIYGDICENSWQLTPAIAEACLKEWKIDCVVPVAAFGCSQPTDEWDDFTRKTGIPVLIDAAGAFGNQCVGMTTSCAFSFHATKCLGIGEGGALISKDQNLIRKVRQFENFGINVNTGMVELLGTNAKLSEFHAAVGLAALERWDRASAYRVAIHRAYIEKLRSHCPEVLQQERKVDGVYTILQVLLPVGTDRDTVSGMLRQAGIETRAWYLPLVPDHPAFATENAWDIPVSRTLGPRMLGLPFHPGLDNAQIDRVCQSLASVLS